MSLSCNMGTQFFGGRGAVAYFVQYVPNFVSILKDRPRGLSQNREILTAKSAMEKIILD